LENKLDS